MRSIEGVGRVDQTDVLAEGGPRADPHRLVAVDGATVLNQIATLHLQNTARPDDAAGADVDSLSEDDGSSGELDEHVVADLTTRRDGQLIHGLGLHPDDHPFPQPKVTSDVCLDGRPVPGGLDPHPRQQAPSSPPAPPESETENEGVQPPPELPHATASCRMVTPPG